jgi:hypothetical protein
VTKRDEHEPCHTPAKPVRVCSSAGWTLDNPRPESSPPTGHYCSENYPQLHPVVPHRSDASRSKGASWMIDIFMIDSDRLVPSLIDGAAFHPCRKPIMWSTAHGERLVSFVACDRRRTLCSLYSFRARCRVGI